MGFRDDFIWGAATASYQVEGAAYEDGKGLSNWDVFCKTPGAVYNGHTGDISCDQYHLFRDDIKLMKELGIQAYRFSLSWPRILPDGVGTVNEKGLAYYDALVDELLANNIKPFITLFHWDMPLALQKRGGWINEDVIQWFSEYAALISKHFSDRVTDYFTINEPQCFIELGYVSGKHAPGWKVDERTYLQIVHNVLRAHGAAVKELRSHSQRQINIGAALTSGAYYPATDSREDIEAAKHATFDCPDTISALNWCVSWLADPMFFGHYPEDGYQKFKNYMPVITEADMKLISQPLDFFGQNIYNGIQIKAGEDGNPIPVPRYAGFPKTSIGWPITPEVLRWAPQYFYERYQKPVYITENGMAAHDVISLDGCVHDPNRVDFYHRYLKELKACASSGTDIKGFFAWSLLDNFEWAEGYNERFGLIHVDYRTQKRTIKDSGYWYQSVIKSNGEAL